MMTYAEFIEKLEAGIPGLIPAAEPAAPAAFATPSAIIGSATPRIDGPLKTTGVAMYASDYHFPNMAYAVPVRSTIAAGQITAIDKAAALKMPGVVLILDHSNIGSLTAPKKAWASEKRTPFADNDVTYYGQYVACVVAETFEQATAAAAAVKVSYAAQSPDLTASLKTGTQVQAKTASKRGDPATAFASAPIKIDQTYTTPNETHNPMEMHATVAVWDGKKYTLYEASQGVVNHHAAMSETLEVSPESLEVISRFIGSGFGGKLAPWPHSAICAVAARQLNRPVKLTLSREMMFTNVGYRPDTEQQIRLGATPDGKLLSLEHHYLNRTSMLDDHRENCSEATPFLYSTANLEATSALLRRNVSAPMAMRGPGAVPGLFALESAMDELAVALKMDPVQLRLGLDTLTDESNGKPFSGRHLKECLTVGSDRFGWSKRTPAIASMRRDGLVYGMGVACASWGAGRGGAQAAVSLRKDGTLRVSSSTQDIGTGTYTVMAQVASDKTGIPVNRIDVVLGASSLPNGPMSGGSTATATIIPAVADGAMQAAKKLIFTATTTQGSPFFGKQPDQLTMSSGRVHLTGSPAESGLSFVDILTLAKLDSIDVMGTSTPTGGQDGRKDYSFHSFAAQFAEVEFDPAIAKLRVTRMTSIVDAGRMINPKTAANQMAGAAIMGVGMALFEETIYDQRSGWPVNSNFADYIVPTSADAPVIDVHFLEIPDPWMGEYGARGVGEIGLAGMAPAIANAVFHATGVRVRNLPIRIEDLMTSTVLA